MTTLSTLKSWADIEEAETTIIKMHAAALYFEEKLGMHDKADQMYANIRTLRNLIDQSSLELTEKDINEALYKAKEKPAEKPVVIPTFDEFPNLDDFIRADRPKDIHSL